MTLKEQMKELCKLGTKAGLNEAVQFLQGFIRKEEEIQKKCKKGKK